MHGNGNCAGLVWNKLNAGGKWFLHIKGETKTKEMGENRAEEGMIEWMETRL
jgi:hypothetical protein